MSSGLIEWIIFLPLAVIAIVTAAGMIITMSMYRAGLALMASFVALAGIFILLDADLLAAIQIMMNVGGMLAMVLFMVMMMMDPGGEMMWGMKRDMHMPGPGAFSMHMPSGSPPPEDELQEGLQQDGNPPTYTCSMHPEIQQDHPGSCPKCGMTLMAQKSDEVQESQQQESKSQVYTCPMHPEIQQDHSGSCPKCGMTLIAQKSSEQSNQQNESAMPMSHGNTDMAPQTSSQDNEHTMSNTDMGSHDMAGMKMAEKGTDDQSMKTSEHDMTSMDMGGHDRGDMDMDGMTPRQNYDMMVDMAMSTTQLPWALAIGTLSAILLIVLLILTPWPLAGAVQIQDASRVVGELLLSRYMISFEGAALLILAGIAGAVLLAKREQVPVKLLQVQQPEKNEEDKRIYTCLMHPEVQQQGAGTCPKCGMTLLPAQETAATGTQNGGPS